MNKSDRNMNRLLQDIWATEEGEIACDAAAILMARAAAVPLSDELARRQYPELFHHFRFCSACAAEYKMLMELAGALVANELTTPASLPPLPAPGQPTIWQYAHDAIIALFPSFSPSLAQQVLRGGDTLNFDPVAVILAEGAIQVDFDLEVDEGNPALRQLHGTVFVTNTEVQAKLEESPVWLQVGSEGPAIHTSRLNDLGDFTFNHLLPGQYSLRLHLAGQEYIITHINIP